MAYEINEARTPEGCLGCEAQCEIATDLDRQRKILHVSNLISYVRHNALLAASIQPAIDKKRNNSDYGDELVDQAYQVGAGLIAEAEILALEVSAKIVQDNCDRC